MKNEKNTIRLFFAVGLFLITTLTVVGQTVKISGRITDGETGEGLPGVTIQEVGTTNGTITDFDGNYDLSVSSGAKILVSFIGYKPQEIEVGGRSSINVSLETDVLALDEVVVVDYGYGQVKKTDFTGSVASIGSKELSKIPMASTAQALTGRLPGVNILTTDGSPDAEVVIRVRGGGSITQDNSPLYVVDGFIVGSIRDIPPTDIESINVLKDAAATAIYGAQAANGVIVITTKTPKAGKNTVSYNGFVQIKSLPQDRAYQILDPYEFVLANYEYEKLRSNAAVESFERLYGTYEDLELYKQKPGRDWQQELLGDPTVSTYHNVATSGGNEKTKYSLSLTTNNDEGILPNNGYQRNVINFKLNQKLSDKLTFDAQMRVTNTVVTGAGTAGASQLSIKNIIQTRPTNGIAEDLDLDLTATNSDDEFTSYLLSRTDPTTLLKQDYRKRTDNNYVFGGSVTWDVMDGLQWTTRFTGEKQYRENLRFYGPETSTSFNNGGSQPLGYKDDREANSYRVLNTAQYSFPFLNKSIHDVKVLLGQEIYSSGGSSQLMYSRFFRTSITPQEMFANMQLGEIYQFGTSEFTPSNRFSMFGRLDYQFKEKYIAAVTLRSDASSRFTKDNRLGIFPSMALGWKISEEAFLSSVSQIDELKLRVSYGATGNDRVPSTATQFLFEVANSRGPGFGNVDQNYYQPESSSLSNPDLVWETTINRNIGIDFSLFKGRLIGSLDFYSNETRDLLLQADIPSSSGFATQYDNIGSTTNKGFELSATGYVYDKNGLTISVNANMGVNKAEVVDLGNATERLISSNWASTDLIGYNDYQLKEGEKIGNILGWITDGYYKVTDFESYDASTGYVLKDGVPDVTDLYGSSLSVRPGMLKLKDISGPDGVPDGVVDDYDRTVLGNGLPDAQGGFGINASYKGLDLQLFFNWQIGNDVYNTNKIDFNQLRRVGYGNMLTSMSINNRFTYLDVDGTYTETPGELVTDLDDLAELNKGKTMWTHASFGRPIVHSWAIEDGSFLRLNQITLGYSLPKTIIEKVGLGSVRFYATGNNLHIWTKYTGYDPEVSTSRSSSFNGLMPGMDYSSFPKSRSYTFGVNITF